MCEECRHTNELLLCRGHWRTDKAFFWAVSPVRPALRPFRFGPLVDLSTSQFAEAIVTSQRNGERQRSFGIGESICGLEESQKDHELSTGEFSY